MTFDERSVVQGLMYQMLNARFSEIARQTDSPFLGASAGDDTLGRTVDVQARIPGFGWRTFATPRTNRNGRFAVPYTFRFTSGVQRYRLRALLERSGDYPYERAASRVVRFWEPDGRNATAGGCVEITGSGASFSGSGRFPSGASSTGTVPIPVSSRSMLSWVFLSR